MEIKNQELKKAIYLTVVVFITHHFSGFLEEIVISGNNMGWIYLFIWYTIGLYTALVLWNKR